MNTADVIEMVEVDEQLVTEKPLSKDAIFLFSEDKSLKQHSP